MDLKCGMIGKRKPVHNLVRAAMAALMAVTLMSCSFQSDTVLWGEVVDSDEVEGVSAVEPTTFDFYDSRTSKWDRFVTIIPYRDNGGLSFLIQQDGASIEETRRKAEQGTDYVVLFFRKLAPSQYVLRHSEVKNGKLRETGLAFLSASGGEFHLLTSIKNRDLRNELLAGSASLSNIAKDILAGGDGNNTSSTSRIDTIEQARHLSAVFHQQRGRFESSDYGKLRVAR